MPSTNGKKDYVLFLGCIIPIKYPQIERAARLTLPPLGIRLVDVKGFSCCPEPWNSKATDLLGWLTVAARNLSVAEEAGREVLTLCPGCNSTLAEAREILLHDAALREEVNGRLGGIGRRFQGTSRVRHVVQVLREEVGLDRIRESVKEPLSDLKVAIHYGCHVLKPREVLQLDDPENPRILEELLGAIGVDPLPYEGRLTCCGSACQNLDTPRSMTHAKLTAWEDLEADCVMVVCPTCFEEFDLGQVQVSRQARRKFEISALYYLQLLGLAQGLAAEQLGLQLHKVKANKVLAKVGISK